LAHKAHSPRRVGTPQWINRNPTHANRNSPYPHRNHIHYQLHASNIRRRRITACHRFAIEIELFAEHPDIVTPTGIDVDHAGRVWAIESNTHFPPAGSKGHPSDRILVMQDTDGDHRADKIVVFTDGLKHTMSIAVKPAWLNPHLAATQRGARSDVFIATRRAIWLYTDDLKADKKTRIIQLDTKGDYPHDGLAGFAFDAMGWMYFGFGENLGADYKVIGSDGVTLSGGAEGGNIYRCRPDGSKLKQWATGFWNPHASCVDAFGRLFTVDNDPDSRPPCRLLHIIEGGDYGFRFRNGRKGLHPFTAWNGEISGTLPMVSGTGEAPSGIVAYESDGFPKDYIGNLLVGSWGDHRIDRFRLKPRGASFESLPETIIQGGEEFRPVGLAVAPDGSLFCTDWVKRDYKLHGHGRVWRISMKDESNSNVFDTATIASEVGEDGLVELLGARRLDVRQPENSLKRTSVENC
jgi:putative membrane-bound dehydrogenase-like protein